MSEKLIEGLREQNRRDSAELRRLCAERDHLRAECDSFQRVGIAAQARADRLAEALRGLMLNPPGGHSCEEFHHYKSDRHMPGDDCPVQLRWNKAVTTAQAALRDHDQEVGNG